VFLELAEVNQDTVETHLALGSLFRRRGEVDRAIRFHQNIIAKPGWGRNSARRLCSNWARTTCGPACWIARSACSPN